MYESERDLSALQIYLRVAQENPVQIPSEQTVIVSSDSEVKRKPALFDRRAAEISHSDAWRCFQKNALYWCSLIALQSRSWWGSERGCFSTVSERSRLIPLFALFIFGFHLDATYRTGCLFIRSESVLLATRLIVCLSKWRGVGNLGASLFFFFFLFRVWLSVNAYYSASHSSL